MAKVRKFKKVFVVCEDNKIFCNSDYQLVDMFRIREHAEEICRDKQRRAVENSKKMWEHGKPIPVHTVHGFYLVHESYFEENI